MPNQSESNIPKQVVPGKRRLLPEGKVGILVVALLALAVVAGGAWWANQRRMSSSANGNSNTSPSQLTNQDAAQDLNRTFERFEATVNRPDTNTPSTPYPSKADTAKAIQALKNTNTP